VVADNYPFNAHNQEKQSKSSQTEESSIPYISKAILGPTSDNPAVRNCCDAYLAMHRACLAAGDGNVFSELDAEKVYRATMPPLSGYQNICNFVACTAHGISIGAINKEQANSFLASAQAALAILRSQPVTPKKPKKRGNKFFVSSPISQP